MIRSGSQERRKKIAPGGSGSGDLDSVAEVVLSFSTVLYPVSTTTTTLGATTTGDYSVLSCAQTIHTAQSMKCS